VAVGVGAGTDGGVAGGSWCWRSRSSSRGNTPMLEEEVEPRFLKSRVASGSRRELMMTRMMASLGCRCKRWGAGVGTSLARVAAWCAVVALGLDCASRGFGRGRRERGAGVQGGQQGACGFHNGLFQGSKRRRVAGGWSPSSGWLVNGSRRRGSRVAGREKRWLWRRAVSQTVLFQKGRGDVQMPVLRCRDPG